MNTVKRIWNFKHFSVKKFFLITGMLCYLILQLICVFVNMSFVNKQVNLINEKEALNQHNVIKNQFYELFYNLEIVKSFINNNKQLGHKDNVNLIPEEEQKKVLQETTFLFDRLVVDSDIIKGVICFASNDNGKSLYYDFQKETLFAEALPTWEDLKASGMENMLNEDLFSISKRAFELTQEKDMSIAWLCNVISDEYLYYDIIAESPVVIILNQDYINEIAGKYETCDIAIYEYTNILRFSLDATFDETDNYKYQNTTHFWNNLSIQTRIATTDSAIVEKKIHDFYTNLFVAFLLCSAVVFFLLFGAVSVIDKSFKSICGIMKKQTDSSEFQYIPKKRKRWTVPLSRYILLGYFIPCMIGVVSWFAFFNFSANSILDHGIQKYSESVVEDFATTFDSTFQRYKTFIESIDLEQKVQEGDYSSEQMDILYQNDVLSSTHYLPGYFYSVLVDKNQENLGQTMFSSNTLLSKTALIDLCSRADQHGKIPCLTIVTDPISLQPKIVFLEKIADNNKVYGYCFFFMNFPESRDYENNDLLTMDFYIKEEQTYINYSSLETLSEFDIEMLYAKDLYTISDIAVENSTFSLVAYGEKESYLQGIDQIQSSMVTFLVMLMIIFIFVANYLTNVVTDSFNELVCNMDRVPQFGYSQIDNTTGIDEINAIVDAYNRMVARLEELMQENVNKAIENNELELLQIKTEFQMLQHQINPHFLFNTLEYINQMSISHKEDLITDMIQDLSAILRYVLKQSNLVHVSEEINSLKAYVNIQKFRMEESNLQFQFDLDETLYDCVMIKFILQPLVENSITHGVMNRKNGVINVSLHDWEKGLEFIISDNGVGMTENELSDLWDRLLKGIEGSGQSSSGIGLTNVYRRVKLYYKEDSDFMIESQKGVGTKITIRLPFVL